MLSDLQIDPEDKKSLAAAARHERQFLDGGAATFSALDVREIACLPKYITLKLEEIAENPTRKKYDKSPAYGLVYVLWSVNRYKIGYSKSNVEDRVKSLQVGNPTKIYTVGYFQGDIKLEKALHKYFSKRRARQVGEWFNLEKEQLAALRAIAKYLNGYWAGTGMLNKSYIKRLLEEAPDTDELYVCPKCGGCSGALDSS